MDDHVSEELTALLDGELSEAERVRVEEHLRGCAPCAAQRDLLQAALGSLARVTPLEPSAELRRRVLASVDGEPLGRLPLRAELVPGALAMPAPERAVAPEA